MTKLLIIVALGGAVANGFSRQSEPPLLIDAAASSTSLDAGH